MPITDENNKTMLVSLVEPTYIIALVTSLFYLSISTYYTSYFQKLSLPFYSLDLPFTFYIYAGRGVMRVIFTSALIMVFLLLHDDYDDEIISIFKSAFAIFIIIFGEFLIVTNLVAISLLHAVVTTVSIVIIYVLITEREDTFRERGFTSYKQLLILIAVIVIPILYYACIIVPALLGTIAAESVIKGDAGQFEVQMDLKDDFGIFDKKTLILVMYNNGKYYLVEKNTLALPTYTAELYIVSNDEIRSIALAAVNDNSASWTNISRYRWS